jgi:uncharacterized protein YfeS
MGRVVALLLTFLLVAPVVVADPLDADVIAEAELEGISYDYLPEALNEHRISLSQIPEPPYKISPKEQYEWNRDHYFKIRQYRRQARKAMMNKITKVDLSGLGRSQGHGLLALICGTDYEPTHITESGKRYKLLGAAAVFIDRAPGASAWGHFAERFIYCYEDSFKDVVFDYYGFGDDLIEDVAAFMQNAYDVDLDTFPEEYLETLPKSHFVVFSEDPVQQRYLTTQVVENRTIYEAWFEAPEQILYEMFRANAKRVSDQYKKIMNHEPLARHNHLTNNCTTDPANDIKFVNPAYLQKHHWPLLTPSVLFRYVQKLSVARIVVYPSQRQLRLMQRKEQGKSNFWEKFAPISKASKGGRPQGWVLVYPEFNSRWKRYLLHPIAGVANLATAIVETAYGIVTLPITLLSRISWFKKLRGKKVGWYRVKTGAVGILASLAEIVYVRVRYPEATEWTEEEKRFLSGLEQTSAILEFLEVKYRESLIIVEAGE